MCGIFGNYKRHLLLLVFTLVLFSCSATTPQLSKLSSDGVILAFGDSLTYGSGVEAQHAYPSILSDLTAHEVINAGVPSEVTALGLARLPDLLDELQPELIILCHGGNDMLRKHSLKQAKANIRNMVKLARARGISVILLAVPELGLLLSPPGFFQELADELSIPIEMDVLSDVLANPALKSDRIHPNREGYRLMAEAVYRLMNDAGAL
jgi:lysophospholipase L1-like esterase